MMKLLFVLAFAANLNFGLSHSCGPNEVQSDCANGGCDRRTCADLGFSQFCRDLAAGTCKPGCICANGFLRDKNGNCVTIAQCSESCGPNKVEIDCANSGCQPRTCADLDRPQFCRDLLPEECERGCVCVNGFLQNENGTCVPLAQCSQTTNH